MVRPRCGTGEASLPVLHWWKFAASHNHAIWTCLVKILGIDGSAVSEAAKKAVTSALPAAQWVSWGDALEMIRKRHPGVAAEIITALDEGHSSPSITAGDSEWLEAAGFEMPSWEPLAQGARPNRTNAATVSRKGWWRSSVFSGTADIGQNRPWPNRVWPNSGGCVCGWFLCVLGVLGVVGVVQIFMDFRGCDSDFLGCCVLVVLPAVAGCFAEFC